MNDILEIKDKTGRWISLSKERLHHLLKHPEMQNKLEEIKETLETPQKILESTTNERVRYYYKYYKNRKSKAGYLKAIVKYLNGNGFIITAYFVEVMR